MTGKSKVTFNANSDVVVPKSASRKLNLVATISKTFPRCNYAGFSHSIARREAFDEAIETFSQQAD
jgi:hypothetical protein